MYGKTTGLDHDFGTLTVNGTKTNDETATVTMAELAIGAMLELETLLGTFEYETIAADGDEVTVTTSLVGRFETDEIGTTTGLIQLLGIVTVVGTKTKEETASVLTFELGIVWMTELETDLGTFDNETTTADGDEAIGATSLAESDETDEAGTTTGLVNELGTVTDDGT